MLFRAMQMVGETTQYELIGQTGHAETVHVTYDANQISNLSHYFGLLIQSARISRVCVETQYRTDCLL